MPEEEIEIYEDDMDSVENNQRASLPLLEEDVPNKKGSSSFLSNKKDAGSNIKNFSNLTNRRNPKNLVGEGPRRKGAPFSDPSHQVGKNNVGKNSLNENQTIAPPNQSAIKQEKEKNKNALQDSIKKNALRSIANLFTHGAAGKISDSLSNLRNKKKKANNAKEKEQNKSSSSGSNATEVVASFGKKKLLITLIPTISVIFIVILVVIAVIGTIVSRFNDLIGVGAGGVVADILGASGGDKELEDLYQRILDVQKEYQSNGKKFAPELIASVYHVLALRDEKFSASDMTNGVIHELADAMFPENCSENGCSYSESLFRDYLKNQFFPKYMDISDCEEATEEVFQYIEDYYVSTDYNNTATGGMCNMSGDIQASDLPKGNNYEQCIEVLGPIANQVYASTGIFASVTLGQAIVESGCGRQTPPNSNNMWGIKCNGSVRSPSTWDGSCTIPVTTSEVISGQTIQIKSTFRKYKSVEEGILDHATFLLGKRYVDAGVLQATDPYDQIIRIKSAGYATDPNYISKVSQVISKYNLQVWDTKSYSSCTTSGDYSTWLQTDPQWKGAPLGSSTATIGSAGCLTTSIAMLVAKSGVSTNVNGGFNPMTFVELLNANHGYDRAGNLYWSVVSTIVPSFTYQGQIKLEGKSKEEKLSTIKQYYDQGYAIVVEVKGGMDRGTHWVAVDSIEGSNIKMMDPASQSTDMWSKYQPENTSKFGYYKIG